MPALTSRPARRFARRLKLFHAWYAVLRERPLIAAIALLSFVGLLAAGLASVLTAAAGAVSSARDLAERGLGNQVALSFREAMLIGSFGSELLAVAVKRQPRCADLAAHWEQIAADVMERVDPAVVIQLELDAAGVVWKTHPPLSGEIAALLYGRDLLKEPSDRPGTLLVLQARQTIIMGPYRCQAGFTCGFVVTPIFLPAPSEDYDWGCGHQPYDCPEGSCWNATSQTKYWGQVSTMQDLDPLTTGDDPRLRFLREHGYRYKLWQAETTLANPYFVLGTTSPPPVDPVVLEIAAYNVKWYLELSPARGWVPPWRDPCLAGVVVGSACVGLLVLWLLVSREQHDRLLRAMLPPKVIKQLQSGETAIAQEYEHVTILFSDIVGYTCVASQLSPRQVVVLLNELFSVFDELTHHNGVYKVETIGDALMCVSGAPVPADPVRSAVRMAHMALDMLAAVEQFRPSLEGVRVQIRVGVHSGPVVAGVVGRKMPRYCLFGDTVNTASRMESTSVPMHIQVSAATAALLRASGEGFTLEPRGSVEVKGKGSMDTFWLRGGPQPSCRSQLMASLHRPPSLVIRPPPASHHRPSNRTHIALCEGGGGGDGFGGGYGGGGGGGFSPPHSSALDTAISLPCFSEGRTDSLTRMRVPTPLLTSAPQLPSALRPPPAPQPPSAPQAASAPKPPSAPEPMAVAAMQPSHTPPGQPSAADSPALQVQAPALPQAAKDTTGVVACAEPLTGATCFAGCVGCTECKGNSGGIVACAEAEAGLTAEAGRGGVDEAEVGAELSSALQSASPTAQPAALSGRGSGVAAISSPLRWETSPRHAQQQLLPQQPQQPPALQSFRRHSVSSSSTYGGGGGGVSPPPPSPPSTAMIRGSAAAAIFNLKALGGSAIPPAPLTHTLAAGAAAAVAAAASSAGGSGVGGGGQPSPGQPAFGRLSLRSATGTYNAVQGAGSSSGGGGGGSSGRLEMARRAPTRRLSMSRPEELSHLVTGSVSGSRREQGPGYAAEPGQEEGRVLVRWMSRDRSVAGSGAFTSLQDAAAASTAASEAGVVESGAPPAAAT